jgi:rubrerythrin
MDAPDQASHESAAPGEPVYSNDGELLGRISSLTDVGFEVEEVDKTDLDEVYQEELPGQEFGGGYLMWRCTECGEMGELDDIPDSCPNCDAPRETIEEVQED